MARLRYLQNKRSGAAGTISKSDKRIYFFDDNAYIYGSSSGVLNLTATTLDLNATTITLDGALELTGDLTYTGTLSVVGVMTFSDTLNATQTGIAITDTAGNGRRCYWQFTATSIEGGEQLTGLQLRASWAGTSTESTSGITGIEIKARASGNSITDTLGTAKAIIANVDCKKATFTTAWGVESQFDLSAGGTITTGAAFRASLNNSGTFSTSYAYLVETANVNYNWDYGLYMTDNQADTGVAIGACSTTNIAISGANVTGIALTGTYSAHGIAIGVSGAALDLVAYDDRLLSIWASSNATGGNVMPLYVSMATDGACKARAAEFVLTPTATLGQWATAVKAYVNLTGASGASGTLAALLGEILLPDEAMDGTTAILELEMVAPASGYTYGAGTVANLAFISMNASGTTIGQFEGTGALINIGGLTDSTGNIWFDNTLRIGIGTTAWYLPMSTAQASYTTAYPIVSTNIAAFDATVTMANTAGNVIRATVTDSGTRTSGDARGLRVAYTIDSAASLTGTAAAIGCGITFTVSDPCPYIYGYKIYTNTITAKTITQIAGHFVYMEDTGNAVQHVACIALNRNISNAGIASDCFLYMRNHGSTAATAFIKSIGTATYWLDFQDGDLGVPLSEYSSGTTVSHRLRVRMPDGSSTYLHLFTS